jgi:Animal haem peroxidase
MATEIVTQIVSFSWTPRLPPGTLFDNNASFSDTAANDGREEKMEPMTPHDEFKLSAARFTRRRFLGTVGAVGAGAAALRIGTLLGVEAESAASGLPAFPGAFGRLFPMLPPFATASDALKAALADIGKPGGLLDANDALSQGPAALILNPLFNGNNPPTNPDNVTHTAGTHFMGQFMDHDMTFDATSPLGQPTDPTTSPNARTAAFDLDSLYGLGPVGSPQLYDPQDPTQLLVGFGGLFEDLPRQTDLDGSSRLTALIGDPRNDENLMVGGLHAAFLRFHNRVVDYVRAQGTSDPATVFLHARLLTTWHYQWLIVHEFLPLFVGQAMVDDILENGAQFYQPGKGKAFIPVEFQTGTYRFGHSMVRPSYRANLKGNNGAPFFGLIFDPSQHPEDFSPPLAPLADPGDLSGGARAPRRFIGWQTFFDFGDGQVKPNKTIDTTISSPLFTLPLRAIPPHTAPVALPQRNLLRHLTWSLPSGQVVAKHLGVEPLSPDSFTELAPYGLGLETNTPLWYYVLREAGVTQTTQPTLVPSPPPTSTTTSGGLRLGPVGGRIVGEVILGLLQADATSYFSAHPRWQPVLPTRSGATGTFRMIDLLTFAQVDPTSRGQ